MNGASHKLQVAVPPDTRQLFCVKHTFFLMHSGRHLSEILAHTQESMGCTYQGRKNSQRLRRGRMVKPMMTWSLEGRARGPEISDRALQAVTRASPRFLIIKYIKKTGHRGTKRVFLCVKNKLLAMCICVFQVKIFGKRSKKFWGNARQNSSCLQFSGKGGM